MMHNLIIRCALGMTIFLGIAARAHATATHINGFAVSEAARSGQYNWKTFAPEGGFKGATIWGKLCKFIIRDGQSVKCDTIFNQLANYPVISLDGKHVAFYRLGATVDYAANKLVGSLTDSGWISVIDTNGQNLRNLVRVGPLDCRSATDWEYANLSWPCGDWIYYERPCKTGEIWRINVNNPSATNMLVVKYLKIDRSKCCNAGCTDQYANGLDGWGFRRFSLCKDATRAAGQYYGYICAGNAIHCFPMPTGDFTAMGCLIGNTGGCNAYISPSGKYFVFYSGSHYAINLSMVATNMTLTENIVPAVNRAPTMGDLAQWTAARVLPYGMMIRWAANSDKWVLISGCHYECATVSELGMDQVAMNWVESSGVAISRNAYRDMCYNSAAGWNCMNLDCLVQQGPIPSNLAGDMFIAGGPANSYEDVSGQWVPVKPVDPTNAICVRESAQKPGIELAIDKTGMRIVGGDSYGSIVELIDMRGRIEWRLAIETNFAVIPASMLNRGVHVLRIINHGAASKIISLSML
jgi:hypothetical protein